MRHPPFGLMATMLKKILSAMESARYKRLAFESGWVVLGQLVAILGSLVLVRVLTEYLTPKQYGELALGLTLAGLVNQVVTGGISAGIARYYGIALEKGGLSGYLQAAIRLMKRASLLVLFLGISATFFLMISGYYRWLGLAWALLAFSIVAGNNASLSSIQNAARQRSVVAFHGSLDVWLRIVFSLLTFFLVGKSSTAAAVGYLAASLVVTVSQVYFLRKKILPKGGFAFVLRNPDSAEKQWLAQIWSYSWPFSAWGIFTWAQLSADRWALQKFSSTETVGLYALLFQLGYTPIALVTGMIVSFLAPIFYQRAGDATDPARNTHVHKMAWRIMVIGLFVTIAGFLATLIAHEELFRLFAAAEYGEVSHLLPWMVLSGGVFASGQILFLKLMSEMRSSGMMWIKSVTALIGIAFSIFGAWIFGLSGVVFALMAFSALFFAWTAILTWRNS